MWPLDAKGTYVLPALGERVCIEIPPIVLQAFVEECERRMALVCRCPPDDVLRHLTRASPAVFIAAATTWARLATRVKQRVRLLDGGRGDLLARTRNATRGVTIDGENPDLAAVRRHARVANVLGQLRGAVGLDQCRVGVSYGGISVDVERLFYRLGLRIGGVAEVARAPFSGQGSSDDGHWRVGSYSIRRT